jgi:nicotinamidase-related amidase
MTPPQALLSRAEDSVLLVVDIQDRLFNTMDESDRERVVHRVGQLLGSADLLGIPIVVTEQYPKGLGPTVDAVRERLPAAATILEKTRFSCCGADRFLQTLETTGRTQVVIAGIETHVCVLQTSLDLQQEGYRVFVAEDATCSRDRENAVNAAARLRQQDVVVTNAESVIFEWMSDSRHEHFKAISALLKD